MRNEAAIRLPHYDICKKGINYAINHVREPWKYTTNHSNYIPPPIRIMAPKKCAKEWCKEIIPSESSNKHCNACRERDRDNQRARRARLKEQAKILEERKAAKKRARDSDHDSEERPAQRTRQDSQKTREDNEEREEQDDDDDESIFGESDNTVSKQYY